MIIKLGKLESIYNFIRNNSIISTRLIYIKTEEQIIFGVYIDGKIYDKLKEKTKSIFENIDFFEIEIGYDDNWDKSYMTLKEEVKKRLFGTVILEKGELIQSKFGTDIVEYDYIYKSEEIEDKEYMSDN